MRRKVLLASLVVGFAGALAGWLLSAPQTLGEAEIAALPKGDAVAGKQVFWAGGCSSCHAVEKSKGDQKLVLAGGLALVTPFGTFRAPNISMNRAEGLGGWSKGDFANAMLRGVSPNSSHYYPAFPYTSYTRMTGQEVADLWAFLQTLPSSDNAVGDHDLGFPFNIRRGLGLWKRLFLNGAPVLTSGEGDPVWERGRHLVEGVAHCGACHTPRNIIGGMRTSRWLAGAVAAEGDGKVPNISPSSDGIGDWSVKDIVYSLESGFTPDFDSFGSSMADVQENMAKLSAEDRIAIATYLKSVPPITGKP